MSPSARLSTETRILDAAERLVQVQGYNGFSYADISEALGIQKASLHHHFATKAELGKRVVVRYSERFLQALDEIEQSGAGDGELLSRYVGLYAAVLGKKRMCLCGMLAADMATLPAPIRAEVNRFFESNESWVARLLERGRAASKFDFTGSAPAVAKYVVSALEGAMLVARSFNDPSRFDDVARRILLELRR